ncbi:5-methylcytosine-specific restriction protein A [Rhizobium azooxidifex]|uniref:5-methylcytosine-specific restriction protein A n=1 Tax=Mycoplana azooxidifex TaxID=1636188 RepID=A0A7W6DEW8_9HYPH|nr:hypothetical protein [Mycoplana azooxidifex]MBB3977729.1 5-methylcytosine-specific restriction protein A [Mycoplana azooxidifex]
MILINDNGAPLKAKIEINASGIVLHSRSGTDRSRDYRKALELLLSRLDIAGVGYEIYVDSHPVQSIPLADRRLIFSRNVPVATRFNEIVSAMNHGTNSHGAWRRLLIEVPGSSPDKLRAVVRAAEEAPIIDRLPASHLRRVTPSHIHRAVERLLDGGDAPNFAPSRDYDVLTDDGNPLAPKKVFGLALEEALGIEAFPAHFSAGWGQISFELLEEAGLWIVPKKGAAARPKARRSVVESALSRFLPTEEEQVWIEGNPKIVVHLKRERHPGLAKRKRDEFVAKHGRLFCEDCGLDPSERYGEEAGPACIEVHHHRTFVAQMHAGHESVTDDLKCLCANCHRVLHRKLALGI